MIRLPIDTGFFPPQLLRFKLTGKFKCPTRATSADLMIVIRVTALLMLDVNSIYDVIIGSKLLNVC